MLLLFVWSWCICVCVYVYVCMCVCVCVCVSLPLGLTRASWRPAEILYSPSAIFHLWAEPPLNTHTYTAQLHSHTHNVLNVGINKGLRICMYIFVVTIPIVATMILRCLASSSVHSMQWTLAFLLICMCVWVISVPNHRAVKMNCVCVCERVCVFI